MYAQTEIQAKFLMMPCPERGNAKEFLRGLRLKKEELAQVGVRISNEEYLSTIISSLPDTLINFASMQMAWTLQQTSKAMDARMLMTIVTPSNILRYNQVSKFICSKFQVYVRILTRSLSEHREPMF